LAVADLLAARELPTDARQLAEIIRRSGRELVDLVDDVLDLSRIEAGALDIAAEPFAPAALMGALAEVWRIAAQAKGLTLEARFDDLPPWMIGDRVRLGQILANVISNAIKYTARGGVTLTARSAPQPSGLQRLTLQVADTGPGIDAGLAARLFKPFARGVAEHSRRETGTGLGLAISRELISLMGGEIVARNGEAGGTEVVVTLDLPLTDPPASLGCAEEAPPAGLERPLRVLVAEDHEVNRRIIGLLLDQLGCSYAMACDGEEAVAAARASAFDVVLMDVRMPRMDGLEATRAIRAGQGPCAATPIIAVTADAMAASDPEIVDAGVSGVLTKPVTLPALAAALGAASDARGQHESPAFSDGATRSSCGGTT
jgi:CheY-like chemotaxis protein